MGNGRSFRVSSVRPRFFACGRVRWYERLIAVHPVHVSEDKNPETGQYDTLRAKNRTERRHEARLSRKRNDGSPRGDIFRNEDHATDED